MLLSNVRYLWSPIPQGRHFSALPTCFPQPSVLIHINIKGKFHSEILNFVCVQWVSFYYNGGKQKQVNKSCRTYRTTMEGDLESNSHSRQQQLWKSLIENCCLNVTDEETRRKARNRCIEVLAIFWWSKRSPVDKRTTTTRFCALHQSPISIVLCFSRKIHNIVNSRWIIKIISKSTSEAQTVINFCATHGSRFNLFSFFSQRVLDLDFT